MSEALKEIRDNYAIIQVVDKDELAKNLEDLKTKQNKLLKCESSSHQLIDKQIEEIKIKLATLDDYPKLDLSFCSQTTKVGKFYAPKFSFIHINDEETEIIMQTERTSSRFDNDSTISTRIGGSYPNFINNYVTEISNKNNKVNFNMVSNIGTHAMHSPMFWSCIVLFNVIGACFISLWCLASIAIVVGLCVHSSEQSDTTRKITLTDSLGDAAIPDDVREIIKEHGSENSGRERKGYGGDNFERHPDRNKKFGNLWIMKEATWSLDVEKPVIIKDLDPLLLGEKDGQLYVLSCFDLTPAEEYISREFAVKSNEED